MEILLEIIVEEEDLRDQDQELHVAEETNLQEEHKEDKNESLTMIPEQVEVVE